MIKFTALFVLLTLPGLSVGATLDASTFGIASNENTFRLQHRELKNPPAGLFKRSAGIDVEANVEYTVNGYLIDVMFGNTTFAVIVDTGSSDTWAITNKTFTPSKPVPNSILNKTYGDGTNVIGSYVKTDVTIGYNGPVKLTNQLVGIGTKLTLPSNSDFNLIGLLGLAYPSLAYYKAANNGSNINFDPFFTTLMNQHPETKNFTLALTKDKWGVLAFGGLPEEALALVGGRFSFTPILNKQQCTGDPASENFTYYSTNMSFVFNGSANIPGNANDHAPNHFIGLIDSGTTNDWVPVRVANAVGALFKPPAIPIQGGVWQQVFCNATPPAFGLRIGDQTFHYAKEEMMFNSTRPGICWSSICGYTNEANVDDLMIISQRFLRGVVWIVDVGEATMWFAPQVKPLDILTPPGVYIPAA